ncbi:MULTISPECIES: hypothetical protein [unclassified Pseudoalteromonas]|uniref:hypothetical protein n=1 Tax=unclassified Pseudoalteromonas TaxID=194690 RepID=UPI002098031D|nr:hypothetical protein [Pseudoalteromonas sp. XMcav2-N]MCO7187806.1 hypothetical protein [Pseudoalteromonas sp. XMcav2-N]
MSQQIPTSQTKVDPAWRKRKWSDVQISGTWLATQTCNKTTDFITQGDTPGNVGICFSGGGSIAMIAALGQMRALNDMGVLGQARAISTVSGGSWAVVPFTYLPDHIDDATFLGPFVEDPSTLTLSTLDYAPSGYLGTTVTLDGIKWDNMAYSAGKLFVNPYFPNNRIWNYQIAKNILEPSGLSSTHFDGLMTPVIETAWFAYSREDAAHIKAQNPGLPDTVHTYQQSEGRIKRPFHLCNTAAFITPNTNPQTGDMLAPVQCTAIATGIFADDLGTVETTATDLQQVGGGLVSSYCFDTQLTSSAKSNINAKLPLNNDNQVSAFSLADVTANSSAFFATAIQGMDGIDPKYNYWSAADVAEEKPGVAARFADGGGIEDNGIANLLAFDDIDQVLSFSNALQSVYRDPDNSDNSWNIVVDMWLPTLFGYTPYQHTGNKAGLSIGYHQYANLTEAQLQGQSIRYFRHNQIFDSALFLPFLQQLWDSMENYTRPAVYFNDAIEVMANSWFNIKPRTIKWLLIHYGPNKTFEATLKPDVRAKLDSYTAHFSDVRKKHPKLYPPTPLANQFPNMVLFATHMEAPLMNLFAHFTSYATNTERERIQTMFK